MSLATSDRSSPNWCPRPSDARTAARGRFASIQGEVLERHLLVVAAVVEEHLQSFGELRCEVLSQRILVQLTAPVSHVRRSDEEQPGDGLLWLLFGEVLEQDESAHRVPDQDHLAVHRGEFF